MNKKLLLIPIILVIIIIFIKSINKNTIKYKIKTNGHTYSIIEKEKKDNYYFEISYNKKVYPIIIFNLGKGKKQITKIYDYITDEYQCILPIFGNKVLTDIMCYKDDIIYNYQAIKDTDAMLDKYVESIKEYNQYDTNTEDKFNNIITYYDEIDKKVSITTYKGLIINKEEIKLFDKDVYNNKISVYVGNYYVTADYNSSYEFEKFYVVNLSSKEVSTIKSKEPISFDSYIQGIVDNKIYLFDPENEIQYEINPKNKKITITSNDYIKYYSNNKWSKVSVKQAKKELLFTYEELGKYSEYDKYYENKYYVYLIKGSNLYRLNKNKINIKTYILDIPVTNINTNEDYIYYVDNDELYYYSDVTGLRLVLINKELEFNKNIKYYIY